LGGKWSSTEKRIEAGIYFPLYLVLFDENRIKDASVWYLSADLQPTSMYKPRNPKSATSANPGYVGFTYDLTQVKDSFVRLL
jgi:type II restriction enzyme